MMNENIVTKIRKKHGITQEELAHTLNVSYTSVNAWETGRREPQERMKTVLLDILESDLSTHTVGALKSKGINRTDSGFVSSVIDYNLLRDTNPYTHGIGKWYGTLPSFLVKDLIKFLATDFNNSGDAVVNFSGSGTVPLELSLAGRQCTAVDANPMAVLMGRVKTLYKDFSDKALIDSAFQQVVNQSAITVDKDLFATSNLITNPNKWILPEVQNEILRALSGINHLENSLVRQLFSLALAVISTEFCSIDKRCTNHYVYKQPGIFVREKFVDALKSEVYGWLPKFEELRAVDGYVAPEIYLGDACRLPVRDSSVNLVFSHPPYGTTINYYAINRVSLSILEVVNLYEHEAQVPETLAADCQKTDLSSGTIKRFRQLTPQWMSEAYRVLKKGGLIVVIIGDSRDLGKLSHPFTDVIIEGEKIGFVTKEILIWITNHKAGMHVKRKGHHIDHNYVIIMEKT